jgi:hypothetical protein
MYGGLLARSVPALMACCVCCGLDEEGSGIRFLARAEIFIVILAPTPGCGVYQPPPPIVAMKEKMASYSALYSFMASCRVNFTCTAIGNTRTESRAGVSFVPRN